MMPLPAVVPQEEHSLLSVEHGWHLDLIHFVQIGLPKILVSLVVAFALQRLTIFFTRRLRRRADALVGNGRRSAQLRTVAGIFRASAYGLIGFYVFIQVLDALGVSLAPFIASAGVIGLGISFGAQSLFKDMLNGLLILLEDQFSVGDSVKLAGLSGSVEDLTLRSTKLRDGDGTLYIIPNSQITTVSNLSRDFSIASLTVSVSSGEDPDRVVEVLRRLATAVRADDAFHDVVLADVDVPGVAGIAGHEVTYPISIRVRANQRDGVLRELRRRILKAFQQKNIQLGTSSSVLVMEQANVPHSAPASEALLPGEAATQ